VWTEITRPKYERAGQRYASDLTDAEWALIEPQLPTVKLLGRPRVTSLRAVLDGILYIARTGCQWRMLPKDFPPFTTVQGYFYDWRDDGLFERINFELLLQAREAAGREGAPRPASSTASRSRPPRAAGRAVTMRPRRSKAASDIS
jgi:transposase